MRDVPRCFQPLAALSLNVDITIEDISRPVYQLGFYSGTLTGQRARNHIRLLLRNHATHAVYNARFELIKTKTQRQFALQGTPGLLLKSPRPLSLENLVSPRETSRGRRSPDLETIEPRDQNCIPLRKAPTFGFLRQATPGHKEIYKADRHPTQSGVRISYHILGLE